MTISDPTDDSPPPAIHCTSKPDCRCEFCMVTRFQPTEEDVLVAIWSGDAEIRVGGSDRVVFAEPTLMCHYIQKRGYQPLEAFLIALASM